MHFHEDKIYHWSTNGGRGGLWYAPKELNIKRIKVRPLKPVDVMTQEYCWKVLKCKPEVWKKYIDVHSVTQEDVNKIKQDFPKIAPKIIAFVVAGRLDPPSNNPLSVSGTMFFIDVMKSSWVSARELEYQMKNISSLIGVSL